MRVIVCGSRHLTDLDLVEDVLKKYDISFIISGGAGGADTLAELYALKENIGIRVYMAQWKTYGKSAGPIRNQEMLDLGKPDMVIAFWDGVSKGTKNMIEIAQKANIPVKIVKIPTENRL